MLISVKAAEKEREMAKFIAVRIKYYRKLRGYTLQNLGALVGISGNQVHKYEKRISDVKAPRLMTICDALDISMLEFFSGFDGSNGGERPLSPEVFELANHLSEIDNPVLAQNLTNIAMMFSGTRSKSKTR